MICAWQGSNLCKAVNLYSRWSVGWVVETESDGIIGDPVHRQRVELRLFSILSYVCVPLFVWKITAMYSY